MADEDFQKEPPQFQKELSQRAARLASRPLENDDNRFRRPGSLRNRVALIASFLGILCLIVPILYVEELADFPNGSFAAIILAWFLGPAALVFGILGVRYRNRHPTAGGLGYAAFGIVMGTLVYLLYSYSSCHLLLDMGGALK
jgi:hypothetical protein